jgi:phosphohistidine phosphatase
MAGPILTLVRHAHAEWPDYTGRDFDRPLTPRGLEDALATALAIRSAGLQPAMLLSSPARRARDTAMILARELGIAEPALHFDDELYNASVATLRATGTRAAGKYRHVLLVGHNPGVSEFARRLTGNPDLALKTADWVTGRLTEG